MNRSAGAGLRRCAALVATVAMTVGLGGAAVAADAGGDPSRFVVQVDGALPTAAQLDASLPSVQVESVRPLGEGLAAVEVTGRGTETQQERALDASPLVDAASPDRRFTVASTRAPVADADPWTSEQWDLWDASSQARAGGFGIDAPRAWTRTRGDRDVVVAVLDTGITPHPDLRGASVLPGYDFVSDIEGIDTGDGGGWDGDPSDPGDACAELGTDSSWHGTFVAGEIVAQRNGTGVIGAAPRVSVLPVRVLGGCGGSEGDSIAAIEWASGGRVPGVPANPNPAQVLSLSLGSDTGECSDALQTAIDDAIDRGTVVVAAAGNDGATMADTSPANCAGVVSVVATTRTGMLAGYSNRGDASITPSIAAPGGSDANPVVGDVWTAAGAFTDQGNRAAIGADQGTSMATPRVAAAVALLLSVRPGLDPADVMQRLAATATPFPAGSTCTEARCGEGIVNAGDLVGAQRVFLQTAAPRTTGTARVGKRLTATSGSWKPSPTAVRYRWLRDGKPVAGATGRAYRLRPRDAGHRIAVRVQAVRGGTLAATATSPARRIPR
ncbi:S8 family serine peptidase [Amnibacterium setariae]|uniref:Peptidase n=1 Tax=Amnibacterium setariae TaxID=2306585 RepID=A0A3A1U077_9MICO|nr:S8 family serine peptidase [Amnibacterium setariae]RIX30314.1 peptidase [Amnibacterium setariae]